MRKHTIAILLLVCAFALASYAQDQTVPAQNPQVPAQTQTMPDQSVPAQTTTQTTTTTTTTPAPQAAPAAPVPEQNVTSALPASDQTPVAQSAPVDQSAISQDLMQRERDSWENAKAKNVSYFSSGLPEDVTASLPGGVTENKSQLDENVRKHGVSEYNLSNMNVTFPSADRAEVTYGASFKSHGRNETAQITSEWQRDSAGNWQNIRVDFR